MTENEFWKAATDIGNSYLSQPSNATTQECFKADIEHLADRFYACGGMLADHTGEPILHRGDVVIMVRIEPFKMTCTAIRKPLRGFSLGWENAR
jgi:hypothetical protein